MPLVHQKRVATALAFLVCLTARPIADGFLLSPSFSLVRSKVRVTYMMNIVEPVACWMRPAVVKTSWGRGI